MVHKAGTALATGATATGITGVYTQTSGRNAAGELKFIHDETGADLAVYVTDPHKELSFEAVFAATVADHDIGDVVTVGTGGDARKYIVTQWDVTESNEDVKKVSIGLRPTTLSEPVAPQTNT
jgi:hypothetical protein